MEITSRNLGEGSAIHTHCAVILLSKMICQKYLKQNYCIIETILLHICKDNQKEKSQHEDSIFYIYISVCRIIGIHVKQLIVNDLFVFSNGQT